MPNLFDVVNSLKNGGFVADRSLPERPRGLDALRSGSHVEVLEVKGMMVGRDVACHQLFDDTASNFMVVKCIVPLAH